MNKTHSQGAMTLSKKVLRSQELNSGAHRGGASIITVAACARGLYATTVTSPLWLGAQMLALRRAQKETSIRHGRPGHRTVVE